MTIIAGIEHGGKTFLGSDSAISSDSNIQKLDRSKIIVGKNIAFAFCSSLRVGQIIQNHFDFSAVRKTERWLYSKFPKLLKQTLEDNGAKTFEDGDRISGMSELIISHSGKIYVLQPDFSIIRSTCGYAALGSGEAYALGSLHSTAALADPKRRIMLALEAACEFDPHCAAPLHIVEL